MSPSTQLLALLALATAAVAQSTITAAPSVTPSAAPVNGPDACQTLGGMFEICNTLTSNFGAMPFSSQASCLCYGQIQTSAYEPAVFDGFYQTCANYLKSASPSSYSAVASGLDGQTMPCAHVGNVASATASDSNGPAAIASAASTLVISYPGASPTQHLTVGAVATSGAAMSSSAANGSSDASTMTATGTTAGAGAGAAQTASKSAASAQTTNAGAHVIANSGLLAGVLGMLAML